MTCKTLEEKEIKQEKADKRELIMNAAMELFKEKGYTSTRIIDIANKAGIGKGTVYAYFESKEDLMLKIIREIVQTDFSRMNDKYANGSTRDRLLQYIDDNERMIEKYGLYATIFRDQIVFDSEVNSEEAIELVRNITEDQYLKLRGIVEKGMDAGDIRKTNVDQATKYATVALGSHMIAMLSKMDKSGDRQIIDPEDVQNLSKEELVDFLLNGLGA